MKKHLALFLVFVLCFASVSCGKENEEPASESAASSQAEVIPEKEDAAETEENVLDFVWDGETIPDSFDLRSVDCDGDGIADRCYVTPVKLQRPYGTCWGLPPSPQQKSAFSVPFIHTNLTHGRGLIFPKNSWLIFLICRSTIRTVRRTGRARHPLTWKTSK